MLKDFTKEDLLKKDVIQNLSETFFQKCDKNADEKVERSELKALFYEIANSANIPVPDEEEITNFFKNLDINDDGSLSRDEFYVFTEALLTMIAESMP